MSSTAHEPAPPPQSTAMPCTPCVLDAKQAVAAGRPIPEPLPGAVMFQGMLLCDIRHTLNVGTPPPPSLLIAGADALPSPTGGF